MGLIDSFLYLLFNALKIIVIIYSLHGTCTAQCPTPPGNIHCDCDATKVECIGIQINVSDIQDILSNISTYPNVIMKISGLQFEPGFKFENMSIKNLTLGYNLQTPSSNFLFELGPFLVSLNLKNNSIEHIDGQLFSSLSNLAELILDFNELNELDSSMFENLMKLQYLSVIRNDFHEVNPDTFQNLLSLQTLVLNHNNLSLLQKVNIKSISLTVLKLEDCSIQGSLHKDTFSDLPNLKKLDLSYNRLTEVGPQSLSSLKHLVYLNLSHNAIEFLQETAFSELNNLTTLDLRKNKIEFPTITAFINLINLKYLDVSNNKLNAIFREHTSDFHALETVYLQNNDIKSFTVGVFFYSPFLKELNVSGNRLECSCELIDIVHYLIHNLTMNKDLESVTCITSTNITMLITDYEDSEYAHKSPCKEVIETSPEDDQYDYNDEITTESVPGFVSDLTTTSMSSITETSTVTKPASTVGSISSPFAIEISTEEHTTSTLISSVPNFSTESSYLRPVTIESSTILTSFATEISTADVSTRTLTTASPDTITESTFSDNSSYTESETTITDNETSSALMTTELNGISDNNLYENSRTTNEFSSVIYMQSSSVKSSHEDLTDLHSTTIITTDRSTETTSITFPSTVQTITTTSIESSSFEKPPTTLAQTGTHTVSTPISLCSSLELSVDSLSSDPVEMVIKNFSYDGNLFCLKWTIASALPPKSRCIIRYGLVIGKKSDNLICPSSPRKVELWSKDEKIYNFCIDIYSPKKVGYCSKIFEKSITRNIESTTAASITSETEGTDTFTSSTISTKMSTETSTFMTNTPSTEISIKSSTFMTTDASTKSSTKSETDKIPETSITIWDNAGITTFVPMSYPNVFNVTSLEVNFNDTTFAYVKWTVNTDELLNVCNLTLTVTTQVFNHNESSFPCKRNALKLNNVKEGEIFEICLFTNHRINGQSFICKHSLYGGESAKSKEHVPNHSSLLIPLICLLVLLILIVIFVIFKNFFKKRQESEIYDVRAEEEKSQSIQIRSSTHDRSSVRYSYISRESPDI